MADDPGKNTDVPRPDTADTAHTAGGGNPSGNPDAPQGAPVPGPWYRRPLFWGIVLFLLILALLGAILFRCVWLAHRSRDPLFAAVAMGVAGVFGAQTILNIGMCLYVAPVVGVTLPFFSYGGSSLLTAFGGVGIVMSMKQEKLGGSGNWPGA